MIRPLGFRKHLLYDLRSRKLVQDSRAFDGGGTLQMDTSIPVSLGLVVGRRVERTEVHCCNFKLYSFRMRGAVDERPGRIGGRNVSVREDFGAEQAEHGDLVSLGELPRES